MNLGYIPEGFELVENEVSKFDMFLVFRRDSEYFQMKVNRDDVNGKLDTEDVSAENIEINNHPGIFMKDEKENTLIWHDGKSVFCLMSNLEKTEMVKIAQNIKSK